MTQYDLYSFHNYHNKQTDLKKKNERSVLISIILEIVVLLTADRGRQKLDNRDQKGVHKILYDIKLSYICIQTSPLCICYIHC